MPISDFLKFQNFENLENLRKVKFQIFEIFEIFEILENLKSAFSKILSFFRFRFFQIFWKFSKKFLSDGLLIFLLSRYAQGLAVRNIASLETQQESFWFGRTYNVKLSNSAGVHALKRALYRFFRIWQQFGEACSSPFEKKSRFLETYPTKLFRFSF